MFSNLHVINIFVCSDPPKFRYPNFTYMQSPHGFLKNKCLVKLQPLQNVFQITTGDKSLNKKTNSKYLRCKIVMGDSNHF